ncbi:MAG: hypothetical protein FWF43_10125, partial [Propionibacteriaceae bacterium]|nr:hypothetical protein [Propionibacteriaceae bacterium]
LVFLLAGCSAQATQPATPSTVTHTRVTSTSTTPTPTPTPTLSPTPSEPVPIGPVGACEKPSKAIIDWIDSSPVVFVATKVPADGIRMVSVGQGNNAGEYWWVVTVLTADSSKRLQSYLTNQLSSSTPSGLVWIDLGYTSAGVWDQVYWAPDRLAAGQQGLTTARSCLSAATATQAAQATTAAPSPTPTRSVPVGPIGNCQAPTDAVMTWLRANGNSSLPASDVTMVKVGEGNQPGSVWYVVAAAAYDSSGNPTTGVGWLTDTPSSTNPSQASWISLYGPDPWNLVDWPADRLAAGQSALQKALGCLP